MTAAAKYLTQEVGVWQLWNSRHDGVPFDFGIVCLWSIFGLDLTALAIAFGFGAEIAEILSIAG